MRIVSGMRSTGELHLGNLITLDRWIELQDEGNECFFFVADWHGLTSHIDSTSKFEQWIYEIVKVYVAAGINVEDSVVFVQSAIKEHAELMMFFSMLISVPRLQRMPTYKDQQLQMSDRDLSSAGFLLYPVLQAADILAYKGEAVPVGEDQLSHIEITRELARRFNTYFEDVFPEPKPILSEVPKLPGTDGRKMSKSYNNYIPIDNDEESLWKQIAPMTTDPARIRRKDTGNPEKCPVWMYHKAFTKSTEEKDWVKWGCKSAGIGCIDCKKLLFSNLKTRLEPIWEQLRFFENAPEKVDQIIAEGNERARKVASKTMVDVRKAMKLRW
ncbi:MAG: tryptophan--tRNA ligase [Kosmotoga sp.]|nr:MAG: tryptophan--tRNA ligase [Kosmotoga sp.]